jgi:hypothetical protein
MIVLAKWIWRHCPNTAIFLAGVWIIALVLMLGHHFNTGACVDARYVPALSWLIPEIYFMPHEVEQACTAGVTCGLSLVSLGIWSGMAIRRGGAKWSWPRLNLIRRRQPKDAP